MKGPKERIGRKKRKMTETRCGLTPYNKTSFWDKGPAFYPL
jgi:hypothetical protein